MISPVVHTAHNESRAQWIKSLSHLVSLRPCLHTSKCSGPFHCRAVEACCPPTFCCEQKNNKVNRPGDKVKSFLNKMRAVVIVFCQIVHHWGGRVWGLLGVLQNVCTLNYNSNLICNIIICDQPSLRRPKCNAQVHCLLLSFPWQAFVRTCSLRSKQNEKYKFQVWQLHWDLSSHARRWEEQTVCFSWNVCADWLEHSRQKRIGK